MLFITHNLSLVDIADDVVVINDGGIAQQGAPEELRATERSVPPVGASAVCGRAGTRRRPMTRTRFIPNDPALPGLRDLFPAAGAPEFVVPAVRSLTGVDVDPAMAEVTYVRYWPGRRCVVQWTIPMESDKLVISAELQPPPGRSTRAFTPASFTSRTARCCSRHSPTTMCCPASSGRSRGSGWRQGWRRRWDYRLPRQQPSVRRLRATNHGAVVS